MMQSSQFGVLDNRFLSRSLGLLDPPQPISVQLETPVRDVVALLQQNKIGCVLVTERNGSLAGIFTERDVLLKVSLKDAAIAGRPVSELMTTNPQTAEMTTTIAFALHMMSQGGYRHIPILDDEGQPVGLISVKDIVDYLANTVTKDLQAFEP